MHGYNAHTGIEWGTTNERDRGNKVHAPWLTLIESIDRTHFDCRRRHRRWRLTSETIEIEIERKMKQKLKTNSSFAFIVVKLKTIIHIICFNSVRFVLRDPHCSLNATLLVFIDVHRFAVFKDTLNSSARYVRKCERIRIVWHMKWKAKQ